MLITKNRQDVITQMNSYASNENIESVGMMGFQLEQGELQFFHPEDFLHKAATYYKQYMDIVTVHYNIQIPPLPENKNDLPSILPDVDMNLNNQALIDYLETSFGDVIDIMYFDLPTLEELESWHDHLLNSAAILAADYKGPSMPKMPYWARYINTYFPVYNKYFGIVPKQDLTSASTGRITMNHLWRNGVSMCLPGNEVPDYGSMIISPYYRNYNGETGSNISIAEDTKIFRQQLITALNNITDWSSFDPDFFVQQPDEATPDDTYHEWLFADFNRMIRTKSYIPNTGALEIILITDSPDFIPKWFRESKMINCDETKFFDLNNEIDFNGSPTTIEELKNNYSMGILDENFVLPTTLTTEPVNPIKIF